MLKRRFTFVLFQLVLLVLTAELVLRVQQFIGPLYDLAPPRKGDPPLAAILNHSPRSSEDFELVSKKVYGEFAGFRFTRRYDANGIRENALRPKPTSPVPKVLFLGDSFIEGYDDQHTVPHIVWESLGGGIEVLNAGHTSYSPSIFIPQARHLLPIVRPDLLVVAIDLTDLRDDSLRYRHLIQRDESGRNVGVSPTPIRLAFREGLDRVASFPFYTQRLLWKLYHTRFVMPRLESSYRAEFGEATVPEILRSSSVSQERARELFGGEIAFFSANLDELAETITQFLEPTQVLMVSYPHLYQLASPLGGKRWNPLVHQLVADATQRHSFHYLNVSPALAARFGDSPEEYYWRNDIHFNFRGIREFASVLANEISEIGSLKK